ncbi:MAG: alpha/beta hydrolase family protein [Kiritimatiellia bacterium]
MERFAEFESGGETVRGVLHCPDTAQDGSRAGIVFLHGWSGCRLGPHRMFVKAARRFAQEGFYCLRIDFRGRGESGGITPAVTIPDMIEDTGRAASYLASETDCGGVILLGICSGSKAAIGAAVRGTRAGALVLWSPEAMGRLKSHSAGARKTAGAFAAYLRKFKDPAAWRKLLLGRVNARLVGKALLGHESAGREETEAESVLIDRFRSYPGKILLVTGAGDSETKRAGRAYRDFCTRERIDHQLNEIPEAGHSFYSLECEREVIELTSGWILNLSRDS